MMPYVLCGGALIACLWNLWVGLSGSWPNLVSAGVCGLLAAFLGLAIVDNISAGCTPWARPEVEFKQGMTLCPGQSATGVFAIPIPDEESEKPTRL